VWWYKLGISRSPKADIVSSLIYGWIVPEADVLNLGVFVSYATKADIVTLEY